MEPLVMADDPTRWGINPGHGLSQAAEEFLGAHVGVPAQPAAVKPWADITVEASRLSESELAGLTAATSDVAVDDRSRAEASGGLSYLDLLARRAGCIGAPDAVVAPANDAEVAAVLAWAASSGVAVVPRGGGTSVVGGLRCDAGKFIALSTHRLTDVHIDAESGLATVGAGITGPELERRLATVDLTLGHYPQSWERASIGGYVATRSAGQASSGYGRSDDMVETLTMVTPRGVLEAGRPPASAAGPDLLQVLVGSEGAFGVITKVTLRVLPRPAATDYTAVVFPHYDAGVNAFRSLVQARSGADVMRLSDPEETAVTLAMSGPTGRAGEALRRYLDARGVQQPAMAILGWEGSRAAITSRHALAMGQLRSHGAVSLTAATGNSWVRHRFSGPYLRDTLMDRGYLVETLETATRWSLLPDLRRTVMATLRQHLEVPAGTRPYIMSHISHVYPAGASLYFTVIACAEHEAPQQQWQQAKEAVTGALVEAGATITHHHAVGRDHAPWLPQEIGPLGYDVLRAVKGALDPQGVLNPGVLGLR